MTVPPIVKKLQWTTTPTLLSAIESSRLSLGKLVSESDLCVFEFGAYGKLFVKRNLRFAADGWVQMGIQLAYYRQFRRFAMTYESCSARLFAEGRSEGVRPLSSESALWCQQMDDDAVSPQDKVKALRAAITVHNQRVRDATVANGCDRHLFGLLVVSVKQQMKGAQAVLTKMLSAFPFDLSTNQVPTRLSSPHFSWQERLAPIGGGFGAVTRSGFGVGYLLLSDRFFFHVHSWRSSAVTSKVFGQVLQRALLDMADLCGSTSTQ